MKFLLNVMLVLAPLAISAQNLIQGLVTDLRTNEPLIGAIVACKDLRTTVSTNADGAYTMLSPEAPKKKYHIITANYIGYKQQSKAIEIPTSAKGKPVQVHFQLEPDPLTIPDVTVSANKVEESLQEVPIAATVIDRVNLKRRTVADTEEAFAMVPNLLTDAYLPSRSTFSIRGLSSDFENLGLENAVGLYIDDVFYSRSYNFNQSLMDIERVEVLRGPQGTLFGKNTIGGVLHLISEKPKMANFTSMELNVGNYNYIQARIKGNLQLIKDKMAVRITGAYRKRDGWLIEQNPDVADQNGILFAGGRVSFLYKPNRKLEINVKGSYSRDEKADFTVDYKTPDDGRDLLPIDSIVANSVDRRSHQDEPDVFFNRENRSLVGRIDYKISNALTFTSISSFASSDGASLRDFDATPIRAAVFGKSTNITSYGQEIRLATPREGRKWFLITGLFYQQEVIEASDSLRTFEGMVPVYGNLAGIPDLLIPNYEEYSTNNTLLTSSSLAIFGSTSYEFTENVRMNLGLRYTVESKNIEYYQTCNCPFSILEGLLSPTIGSAFEPIIRDANDGVLSGNLGLDFRTTDNMLIYFNLSRGFKGSGFNAGLSPDADPDNAAIIFDPEFVNSYEFGFKVKAGNRYTLNTAIFITDFRNKQEVVTAGNSLLVRNARSVQGQGIEIEFLGVVNKFFKTEIALGALNLKYTDFPFVDPFTYDEINLSGNRALKAPDYTFKFSPELHTPMGRELKFLMRMDFNLIGKSFNDIYNTESLARRPSALVNGRMSIASKNERFGIAVWIKNILNESYIQHGWTYIFGDQIALNPPRMMGVEFRANIY